MNKFFMYLNSRYCLFSKSLVLKQSLVWRNTISTRNFGQGLRFAKKYDSRLLSFKNVCWISKPNFKRAFSDNTKDDDHEQLTLIEYEKLVENTLQNMAEFVDEILETADQLTDTDVSLSDGILKVSLGVQHGTYVINKQTPNKQIWLSSPFSGPKRFDYTGDEWIYKRTGVTLSNLLSEEFTKVLERKVKFPK